MSNDQLRGGLVIAKTCRLLRMFDRQNSEMSLAELARGTGVNTTTAYRLLQALVKEDILLQDADTAKYSLGFGLVKLGEFASKGNNLLTVTQTYLEKLAAEWGETIVLDVLDHNLFVLTVLHVQSSFRLSITPNYDKPVWPHCIATGKILLAYLPEARLNEFLGQKLPGLTPNTIVDPDQLKIELGLIRTHTHSVNLEEQEVGLNAVATPIFDMHQQAVAALSIGGPAIRLTRARIPEMVISTMQSAKAISKELGCSDGFLRARFGEIQSSALTRPMGKEAQSN